MATSRTAKVLALSSGTALTQLVTLVSLVVLARFLTKEDLATYRQALLSYQFVAPALTLGLPTALYYFLPRHPGRERSVIFTALLALASLGAILALFLSTIGADFLAQRFNNNDLAHALRSFAAYPLAALPLSILEACLVSRERVFSLAVFNVISRAVLAGVLIAACIWMPRPETLLRLQALVAACMLPAALALMWRATPPGPVRPRGDLFLQLMKYGLPIGAASILGTMTLQLPAVIVSSLCTPEEFAIYSVGAFELPLVGIATGSIATVLLADMSKLIAAGRKQEALQLFGTGSIRSAVLLLPAMAFLFVAAEPLIVLLFSQEYRDSVIPFRLYLLILPVRIVFWGSLLAAAGLNSAILIRSIGDLCVTGILATIFVTWLGYWGALLGLLCALYLWSIPFNLFTVAKAFACAASSILPIRPLTSILWRTCVAALLVCPILHYPWAASTLRLMTAAPLFMIVSYSLLRKGGYLPGFPGFRDILGAMASARPRADRAG